MIVACRAAITTISTLRAEYVFAPVERATLRRYRPRCLVVAHLLPALALEIVIETDLVKALCRC